MVQISVVNFLNAFQIIKLITFTTSGGAYLNFMGNEFAHPKVSTLIFLWALYLNFSILSNYFVLLSLFSIFSKAFYGLISESWISYVKQWLFLPVSESAMGTIGQGFSQTFLWLWQGLQYGWTIFLKCLSNTLQQSFW